MGLILAATALFSSLSVAQNVRPCMPKIYPGLTGGTVCVCNATYCDDVAEIGSLGSNEAAVYLSSANGSRLARSQSTWMKMTMKQMESVNKGKKLKFQDDPKAEGVIVKVNASQRYQTIIGFGGAFTDTTGVNLNALSDGARQNLINSYFASNGLQYSLGRVPMASCDFSPREYSYDDIDQDFSLSNFNLTDEDRQLKIPFILRALQLTGGDFKLFASPWSAPAWMKSNGHMKGGGTLKGSPDGPYYTTWANYFVKYEAYSRYNITFWGITAQNEPMTGIDPNYGWQTMYFNDTMQRDFIKNQLGPILRRSIFGNRIALMTMDDQRFNLPHWADTIFTDSQASFYTAGIGVHWYEDIDGVFPPSLLTDTHTRYPDKFILATEACTGYWPWEQKPNLGDWLRGEQYGHDIIQDLNHWVAGWTDWNLALDPLGGPNWVTNRVDSPVIVNATADEFYKQPMFYVMGHFSKFIRPNSVRIGLLIEHSTAQIEGTAFSSPDNNQRVMVMSNRHQERTYRLAIQDASAPGKVLTVNLPPQSIATVIWNKAA